MRRFRIATYNIHKAQGMDGRTRVDRIADVLGEINADIVALQEVVCRQGRIPEQDQARYLADKLGYSFQIGETRKHCGAVYGNVTLSRHPIRLTRFVDLTVAGREQRGALRTDIRIGREVLHVFNVHLGTSYLERRRQAPRLVDGELLHAVDISGPRVILGDFNEWTRGLVTHTLSAEFHRTDLHVHLTRRRTYPALFPLLHLDHIYYDHHLQVDRAFFHRSRATLIASDHLPLVADLHLRRAQPHG
jgi:endonuclease/exonuclease/phosphatase family metal-dependent hydrolase